MNNQVLLLSVVVLSVSVAFLFFQNMKLSKKVEQQYKLVNGHINDLSQTIALNNRININGGGNNQVMNPNPNFQPPNLQNPIKEEEFVQEVNIDSQNTDFAPIVTPEFQEEINQLKSDYNDYELSNELKNEIDNLERQEEANIEASELAENGIPLNLTDANLEQHNTMNEMNEMNEFVENVEHLDNGENFVENSSEEPMNIPLNVESLNSEEMEIEELETNSDEISQNNSDLNNEIIDWNNDIQEISIGQEISHDTDEIRAEVAEGVNELVGNIIASASDLEVVQDENSKITLENNEEQVLVNINNEQRTLEDLNGNELKEVCKTFNLKAKGKKIELIERIKEYQLTLKNSKNFFVYTNN